MPPCCSRGSNAASTPASRVRADDRYAVRLHTPSQPPNAWERLASATRIAEKQLTAIGESIDTPGRDGIRRLHYLQQRLAIALKVHAGRMSDKAEFASAEDRVAAFRDYRTLDALRQLV